jgi:hypothetical protein
MVSNPNVEAPGLLDGATFPPSDFVSQGASVSGLFSGSFVIVSFAVVLYIELLMAMGAMSRGTRRDYGFQSNMVLGTMSPLMMKYGTNTLEYYQ